MNEVGFDVCWLFVGSVLTPCGGLRASPVPLGSESVDLCIQALTEDYTCRRIRI